MNNLENNELNNMTSLELLQEIERKQKMNEIAGLYGEITEALSSFIPKSFMGEMKFLMDKFLPSIKGNKEN
jgi:hypothetical protein